MARKKKLAWQRQLWGLVAAALLGSGVWAGSQTLGKISLDFESSDLTLTWTSAADTPEPAISGSSSGSGTLECELALVQRVIDGDTVELEDGRKVRYLGMDTPEMRPVECYGEQARAENRRLVEGKSVCLEKDVSEVDRYGRLLRYVYVDELLVNEWLVQEGFAQIATYPPDVKYQARLQAAESQARAAGKGLWGEECVKESN